MALVPVVRRLSGAAAAGWAILAPCGGWAMRILIHDYAGHPFQVQLSRALAARGHAVLHLSAAYNPTPKGALAPRDDDAPGFAVEGLTIGETYVRYSFVTRWRQERAYGRVLARRIAAWAPDVALFCNTPLDTLGIAQAACRRAGARFVFWVQDLSGIAAERILCARLPVIGEVIGRYHIALERRIARHSDALVLITVDFVPLMERWGIAKDRLAVIENWSPLDAIHPAPRDNAWAREHGLAGRLVILYTGMMGLKHNPSLGRDLAVHMKSWPEVAVVVVSEGLGADWLAGHKTEAGLDNLILLGFQPFEPMSEVLASADVLLAILEADAGVFSVPSKVLGYLCAGRAILASVPPENLAARILVRHEAGLTVDADDAAGLAVAADRLIAEPGLRERLGQNGLEYAKRTFDIDAITTRFEAVIARAAGI